MYRQLSYSFPSCQRRPGKYTYKNSSLVFDSGFKFEFEFFEQEGRHVLTEIGADVFFNEFQKNVSTDKLKGQIDQIMTHLVRGEDIGPMTATGAAPMNPFATKMPAFNQ